MWSVTTGTRPCWTMGARARREEIFKLGKRSILREGFPRISLFEPSNEANNERGECGENVGEQFLLPQPPPCRLLFLFVPDRMGLALFDVECGENVGEPLLLPQP